MQRATRTRTPTDAHASPSADTVHEPDDRMTGMYSCIRACSPVTARRVRDTRSDFFRTFFWTFVGRFWIFVACEVISCVSLNTAAQLNWRTVRRGARMLYTAHDGPPARSLPCTLSTTAERVCASGRTFQQFFSHSCAPFTKTSLRGGGSNLAAIAVALFWLSRSASSYADRL